MAEVVMIESQEHAGRLAADAVAALLRRTPFPVLGLATGSSPAPVYRELSRRVEDGALSLSRARAFLLDEYVGLPAEHPQRYRQVIQRQVVEVTDLDPTRVYAPDGMAEDLEEECAAYERRLRAAGGVDLQLLGIGANGHIGFNEPGSSLGSRTRLKTLTPRTRADNARFFDDEPDRVPEHCLTQGIGTIMDARHLILLAFGQAKAEAVHQLVEGPVSARWPATALQWHPHVSILIDEAAGSRLELADTARDAWSAKPAWKGL